MSLSQMELESPKQTSSIDLTSALLSLNSKVTDILSNIKNDIDQCEFSFQPGFSWPVNRKEKNFLGLLLKGKADAKSYREFLGIKRVVDKGWRWNQRKSTNVNENKRQKIKKEVVGKSTAANSSSRESEKENEFLNKKIMRDEYKERKKIKRRRIIKRESKEKLFNYDDKIKKEKKLNLDNINNNIDRNECYGWLNRKENKSDMIVPSCDNYNTKSSQSDDSYLNEKEKEEIKIMNENVRLGKYIAIKTKDRIFIKRSGRTMLDDTKL